MRKSLRLLLIVLVIVQLAFFSACTQEVYEKGDSDLSLLQADFVEAHVAADGKMDYVVTDEGEQLFLTQPVFKEWASAANTFCRALLHYNKVEGKAEMVNMVKVSILPLIAPADLTDGVKEDPVDLESIWTDKRNRYLTIGVKLKTGQDDNTTGQYLAVCCDRIVKGADNRVTYHLRLYHDQGDVPQYYSSRYYMSVPLFAYDADSVRMTVQTYSGAVTKAFRVSP